MAFLEDPDPSVKKAAGYTLGQMVYRPAIPQLLALLKDPNLWVRDAAVLSLALFESESLHPIDRAMPTETKSFKILALDVFARIRGKQSKAIIEKYINDPDEDLRRAAKRAIFELKSEN